MKPRLIAILLAAFLAFSASAHADDRDLLSGVTDHEHVNDYGYWKHMDLFATKVQPMDRDDPFTIIPRYQQPQYKYEDEQIGDQMPWVSINPTLPREYR